MPGPVSDSYDPEFGTGANAHAVKEAIEHLRNRITKGVFDGDETLKNIVEIAMDDDTLSPYKLMPMRETEWRIIRFCLNRALESI